MIEKNCCGTEVAARTVAPIQVDPPVPDRALR